MENLPLNNPTPEQKKAPFQEPDLTGMNSLEAAAELGFPRDETLVEAVNAMLNAKNQSEYDIAQAAYNDYRRGLIVEQESTPEEMLRTIGYHLDAASVFFQLAKITESDSENATLSCICYFDDALEALQAASSLSKNKFPGVYEYVNGKYELLAEYRRQKQEVLKSESRG